MQGRRRAPDTTSRTDAHILKSTPIETLDSKCNGALTITVFLTRRLVTALELLPPTPTRAPHVLPHGQATTSRSAHAETVLASMSNSKRSSGDAFDKHANELSAMLAESWRWLADVEAAEAEAGLGRVSARPPSHVAEELYSPRVGSKQDDAARDLAAVQESKELLCSPDPPVPSPPVLPSPRKESLRQVSLNLIEA